MLVNASFIFSSCRLTLPSYTTLPIRVTTPPMSVPSTLEVIDTRRPVRCSIARPIASAAPAGSGTALVTSARTTFWKSSRRLRYSVEQVRQQHQPIAPGQQRDELRHDRAGAGPRRQLPDQRHLARGRDGRAREHPRELVVPGRERHEGVELALDGLRVALLPAHVEQRLRVAGGGTAIGHSDVPFFGVRLRLTPYVSGSRLAASRQPGTVLSLEP